MPLMCYVLRHSSPNILIQNGIIEKSCFINDNEQSTYFFFFFPSQGSRLMGF